MKIDWFNRNRMLGFRLLFPVLIIMPILAPGLVQAKWSLTPRIYVEEQYDDNIFLTETNRLDDYITTVSPGVNLHYSTPTDIIDLDYEFQRFFYSDFPELDFSGHRGRAVARKDFSPQFSAGIREIIIRSEDPIELTGVPMFERPSIRINMKQQYTRNIVEPDMTFRFGEERSLQLKYRNNILRNKRDDIADQDQDAINALLAFHFDVHNGIEIFAEHINQDYYSTTPPQPSRDFDGDEIRGRYTYYYDPITSAFLEYRYYERDFDLDTAGFIDYEVHDPRLGFSWDLDETVSVTASAGYSFRKANSKDDEKVLSGRLDFSGQYKRLTADVYGEAGFDEDFLSAEILGFYKFWRVGFNGSYQLLERLDVQGFVYREKDRFVDLDREDRLWSIRAGLQYQLMKWLFLAFDYQYNMRDSNIPFESYRDNRYSGRITTQYDIAELFE